MLPSLTRRIQPLGYPAGSLLNRAYAETSVHLQQPPRDNALQPQTQSEPSRQNASIVEQDIASSNLVHRKHNHSSDAVAPGPTPHNQLCALQSDQDMNEANSCSIQNNVSTTTEPSQYDTKNESVILTGGWNRGNSVLKRKQSLCLPTVSLPDELQATLKSTLSGHPQKSLTSDGQSLTKFLLSRKVLTKLDEGGRKKAENNLSDVSPWENDKQGSKRSRSFHVFKYGKREAIAFAAGRTQAVYGTTLRVLSEVARREPSFKPETLLDFGSGLGTAVWAARQLWAESIYEYQCVDVSREMGDLARVLRGGESPNSETAMNLSADSQEMIPGVHFRQYLPLSNKVQYDVVVSAHTLGEIPSVKLRRMFIAALWRKTKNFLVLIEPGHWSGFNIITEARDMVLQASKTWTKYEDESSDELAGHVFAPCPHDLVCPLTKVTDTRSPCHFGQRVQLSFSERNGPLKNNGFKLENFSYVVLKKGERCLKNSSEDRILQPVRKRSRHIICKLCTRHGEAKEMIFTKSKHRELYKQGRQSKWGDVLSDLQRNVLDTDVLEDSSG